MKKIKLINLIIPLLLAGCNNNEVKNMNSKENESFTTDLDDESSSKTTTDYKKTNYHTHTKRCGHASGEDEDYIKEAIAQGYDFLGFSDHIMLPYQSNDSSVRGGYFRINEYIESINALKEKYKDKIGLLVGFEAEWDMSFYDYYTYLIDNQVVDYLIFGNHYTNYNTNNGGSFGLTFYREGISKNDILEYLNNALDALDTGFFSIFAHPDYFMATFDEWDDDIANLSRQVCRKAKEKNVALEINQGEFNSHEPYTFKTGNKSTRYRYPYAPFWQIAKEEGNTVVTGIDAHAPEIIKNKNGRDKAFEFANEIGLSITEDLHIESKTRIEATKGNNIIVENGTGGKILGKFDTTTIEATIPNNKYFDYWEVNGKKNTLLKSKFNLVQLDYEEKETKYVAHFKDAMDSYTYTFTEKLNKGDNTCGALVINSSANASHLETGTNISRGLGFLVANNSGKVTLTIDVPFTINNVKIEAAMGSSNDVTMSIKIGTNSLVSNKELTTTNTLYSYKCYNLEGKIEIIFEATASDKITYIKSISIS